MISQKKQFLSVFVIFVFILLVYFLVWSSSSSKMIEIFNSQTKGIMKFESIKKAGFPFQKKIVISNAEIKSNKLFLNEDRTTFDRITFSSFMFGDTFKIKLKNGKYFVNGDSFENTIEFNENPNIIASFYSNGYLKSILYSDKGYKIMSKAKTTILSSDSNLIEIKSIKNKKTIDYAIDVSMKNMQNIYILNLKPKTSKDFTPDSYSFNMKSSLSLTGNNYIFNIEDMSLVNKGSDFTLKITGRVSNSVNDENIFGNLIFSISKFNTFRNLIEKKMTQSINQDINASASQKSLAIRYMKSFLKSLNEIKETKGEYSIFEVDRKEGGTFYTINGVKIQNMLK